MSNNVEFQMVCGDCGSLAIKIENPVSASRETIVHCRDCGASRGTMGALKRPSRATGCACAAYETAATKSEILQRTRIAA
jgi:hypothetical protein